MSKGLDEINASRKGLCERLPCRASPAAAGEMYADSKHRDLNRAKPCWMKHFPGVAGHDHLPGLWAGGRA